MDFANDYARELNLEEKIRLALQNRGKHDSLFDASRFEVSTNQGAGSSLDKAGSPPREIEYTPKDSLMNDLRRDVDEAQNGRMSTLVTSTPELRNANEQNYSDACDKPSTSLQGPRIKSGALEDTVSDAINTTENEPNQQNEKSESGISKPTSEEHTELSVTTKGECIDELVSSENNSITNEDSDRSLAPSGENSNLQQQKTLDASEVNEAMPATEHLTVPSDKTGEKKHTDSIDLNNSMKTSEEYVVVHATPCLPAECSCDSSTRLEELEEMVRTQQRAMQRLVLELNEAKGHVHQLSSQLKECEREVTTKLDNDYRVIIRTMTERFLRKEALLIDEIACYKTAQRNTSVNTFPRVLPAPVQVSEVSRQEPHQTQRFEPQTLHREASVTQSSQSKLSPKKQNGRRFSVAEVETYTQTLKFDENGRVSFQAQSPPGKGLLLSQLRSSSTGRPAARTSKTTYLERFNSQKRLPKGGS